jgi:Holliday junction resolvasome RuvABC DNA-binding subunit
MAVWQGFRAFASIPDMARKTNETDKTDADDFRALASRKGLTPAKLIEELAVIATADIADFVTVSEDGAIQAKPLTELKGASRAVRKIREKTVITEKADGSVLTKTSTLEYELHPKLDAVEAGLKIHGMKAPEKREVSAELKAASELPPYMKSALDEIYTKAS